MGATGKKAPTGLAQALCAALRAFRSLWGNAFLSLQKLCPEPLRQVLVFTCSVLMSLGTILWNSCRQKRGTYLQGDQSVIHLDLLGEEVCPNRCLILVGELLSDILIHQRSFADAASYTST